MGRVEFLDKLEKLTRFAMERAEELRDKRVPNLPAEMEYHIGHILTAIADEKRMVLAASPCGND